MRKILVLGFAMCLLAACDSYNDKNDQDNTDTVSITYDETVTHEYAPVEGDVIYYNGKVQVYKNDTWVDADEDVKVKDGIIVYRDGRAVKNGTYVVLEDGYIVDREGNVWDRAGNTISDAWNSTKHGVKKAGKAIGDAAKKAGDKVKDAVD